MKTKFTSVSFIISFFIHAALFITIYMYLQQESDISPIGNDAKIESAQKSVYENINNINNSGENERREKIEESYHKKYQEAYRKINDSMNNIETNKNYNVEDFAQELNENQEKVDTEFGNYTRQMIDEDITNNLLKNNFDFIRKSIKEDLAKELKAMDKGGAKKGDLKKFRELSALNRETTKSILNKLDKTVLKKYESKVLKDIKQKYSSVSLEDNGKKLKKLMDESSLYLKSKLYKEIAKQDILKDVLKEDSLTDKPDLNGRKQKEIESIEKSIEKMEKSMDSLIEKSEELDSEQSDENMKDYAAKLDEIDKSVQDDLLDLKKEPVSDELKETAGNMLGDIDKNKADAAEAEQLKDEYKKEINKIAENISGLNFQKDYELSKNNPGDNDSTNGLSSYADLYHESKEEFILNKKLSKKIDKSIETAAELTSSALDEESYKNDNTYNTLMNADPEKNNMFNFGERPSQSYGQSIVAPVKGTSFGNGGHSAFTGNNKGHVSGSGAGGGDDNGSGFGIGYGGKSVGDQKFTREITTAHSKIIASPQDLLDFMKKYGSRTKALDIQSEFSRVEGEMTEAIPVSYEYPQYVYVEEDQNSRIEELAEKNNEENKKRELKYYSRFPAYACIPYQPYDLKIDGDLSDWGKLEYPIQMQWAANDAHTEITNGIKLYMRWNESGLYFCYKVEKKGKIVLPDELEDEYDNEKYDVAQDKCDGDTLEFWLDQTEQQQSSIRGQQYAREFTFCPFSEPNLIVEFYRINYANAHDLFDDYKNARVSNRITPDGYIVEGFLSKEAFPKKTELHSKMQLVCNFSINTGSDWGPASTQWSASRAIRSRYRPNTWGAIELMGYTPEISVKDFNEDSYNSDYIFPGQAIKIYIKDPERVSNPHTVELISAKVGIAGSPDEIRINLAETEKKSGIFCASINTRSITGEMAKEGLPVKPGDIIYIEYEKYNENSSDARFNKKYCHYLPVVNPFYTLKK